MSGVAFDPYYKWLGVPPEEQPAHFYRLLALALFESDPDVIANAADRTMGQVRTFQAGPHGAISQRLLNELSVARLTLLSPEKKKAYDAQLQAYLAQRQASQPAASGDLAGQAAWQPEFDWEAVSAPSTASPSRKALASNHRQLAKAKTSSNRRPIFIVAGIGVLIPLVFGLQASLRKSNADAPQPTPARPLVASSVKAESGAAVAATTATTTTPTRADASAADNPKKLNLLKRIDLNRDILLGNWRVENGQLVSGDEKFARLLLPGEAPANYRLTVRGKRDQGDDLILGLVIDGRQVVLGFDCFRRAGSGLSSVDGRHANANVTHQRRSNVLGDFQPYTIVCTVQGEALSVTLNGEPFLQWSGSSERLSVPTEWAVPAANRNQLYLGAYSAVHRLDEVLLEPLPALPPPSVTPSPALPAGSIDLLAKIHPLRDSISGQWLYRPARPGSPRALLSPSTATARVRIPYVPPDNYVLTIEGVREMAGFDLMAGLVVGKSQVGLYIDGLSATVTGLGLIDGQHIHRNGRGNMINELLKVGQPYKVECTVRDGSVNVVVNGLTVVAWHDGSHRLSLPGDWAVPHQRELFLGSYNGVHRLERVSLLPLENAKFPPADTTTYLCDQPLTALDGLWYGLPLRANVVVNKVKSPHGLFMHPTSNGSAHAAFDLAGKFREFIGQVGINDSTARAATPLVFRIVGDGRELWKSPRIHNRSNLPQFQVDVSGVRQLELFVDCPGWEGHAHAVWIEPLLR